MLVLSRKEQEAIAVGQKVVITILKIKGSSVRLGIEAPREVSIKRQELPAAQPAAEGFDVPTHLGAWNDDPEELLVQSDETAFRHAPLAVYMQRRARSRKNRIAVHANRPR